MTEQDPFGIHQKVPGAKLDADKPDGDLLLLFAEAMEEILRVGTMGMEKYVRGGFLEVPDATRRYSSAMIRHYFKERTEGKYDLDPWYDTPEGAKWKGKIRHDAQVAWNAIARLTVRLREERDEANNTDEG